MTYLTEDDAIERIERLKLHGVWPGMIRRADGRFVLTFDPPISTGRGSKYAAWRVDCE